LTPPPIAARFMALDARRGGDYTGRTSIMRVLCIALAAGAVMSLARQASAGLVNGVEAIVHDTIITEEEVTALTDPDIQMLLRQYRNQPELLRQKAEAVRTNALEKLLERQLILHDFKTTFASQESAIEKELDKDIEKDIQDEIRSSYGGNRMALVQTLQARGITLEKHRQQIRDRIIVSWLRQKNVSSEVIASPHKVEAYYLAHADKFKVQDQVKLRMIVLKSPEPADAARTAKRAEEILAKLKEGATFVEMAGVYSEGSQRNQGGDMDWWEQPRLSKGLADLANSLQPGQHSGVTSRSAGDDYWVCQYEKGQPTLGRHYAADPVSKKESLVEEKRFDSGAAATNLPPPQEFYLMLVEDKRPAHLKPLAEARDEIEKDLVAEERTRLEKLWIERLRKKTFVRYF
jgi:parvulin-like peptidyl-prolyl isomerase